MMMVMIKMMKVTKMIKMMMLMISLLEGGDQIQAGHLFVRQLFGVRSNNLPSKEIEKVILGVAPGTAARADPSTGAGQILGKGYIYIGNRDSRFCEGEYWALVVRRICIGFC